MVSFLFVIDTLHVYLLCSLFWQITVIGHMIYDTAQPMPWPLMGSFIVSFVVTFVVQAFFCLRIWRFGHKYRIVAGIIAVTALSQIGGGWAFAIPNITNKLLKEVSLVPFQIELVSSLLCDVAISSSLIYYFRTNRGIHRRTETILQKLILFSVNQGLLLSIVTIITLVYYEPKANVAFSLPSQFILSKLYVNCLLATLNSRKEYREIAGQDLTLSLSSLDNPHHDIDPSS